MKIFYRISNNSYKKNRLPHASKEHCLDNFLSIFGKHDITIIADNVTDASLASFIKSKESPNIKIEYTSLNNAHAFRHAIRKSCKCHNLDILYLVEDDYLHLPKSDVLIEEGLGVSSYVSLYDHPDKYLNAIAGGNPMVEDGGEVTRVILTNSSHWKLTNSTTCTWAAYAHTIMEDMDIWEAATTNSYPQDYWAFTNLIGRGRSLITPIKGYSTHTELPWLSPFIDWTKI